MKKNTIILIVLIIFYIPLIFVDLFLGVGSAISFPCRYTDFACLIRHQDYKTLIENVISLTIIVAINLLFIIPILIYIKKTIQELRITNNNGGKE